LLTAVASYAQVLIVRGNVFNFGFHSSVSCMQVFICLHLGFS